MNAIKIERLLANQPNFQGVFSSDTLPSRPRLLVCNTDPSWKPGNHWIAICVDENRVGEYFDSFGRKPSKEFERYLNTTCIRWVFNKRCLQSRVSATCGYYCTLFIVLKSRGFAMSKIVGMFTNDTGYNDYIVHRFICNKR